MNVYMDGSTDPDGTFTIRQGSEEDRETGPAIRVALSSGTLAGAYDIDFFSYKLGVTAPVPERTTGILAAIGLLGLVAFGWRRSKRAT